MKYWEIIADRLHAEGWSYGIAEHFTQHGFLYYVDARAFRVVRRSSANTRLDVGKANLQLIANEENQDRAECGKNEAGGVISFVCRAGKHVGNSAADDRPDDAQHDRPENGHVRVHHRFRDNPSD